MKFVQTHLGYIEDAHTRVDRFVEFHLEFTLFRGDQILREDAAAMENSVLQSSPPRRIVCPISLRVAHRRDFAHSPWFYRIRRYSLVYTKFLSKSLFARVLKSIFNWI